MWNMIKKIYWKIVEQADNKQYEHLFKPTYKGLENYHLTKFKWKD